MHEVSPLTGEGRHKRGREDLPYDDLPTVVGSAPRFDPEPTMFDPHRVSAPSPALDRPAGAQHPRKRRVRVVLCDDQISTWFGDATQLGDAALHLGDMHEHSP